MTRPAFGILLVRVQGESIPRWLTIPIPVGALIEAVRGVLNLWYFFGLLGVRPFARGRLAAIGGPMLESFQRGRFGGAGGPGAGWAQALIPQPAATAAGFKQFLHLHRFLDSLRAMPACTLVDVATGDVHVTVRWL
ncbi:MAG TPA: hypothetical protein VFK80_00040 [Limnochordia bacterium]|nr:hypothetical protein [Limnochordia bacterium]